MLTTRDLSSLEPGPMTAVMRAMPVARKSTKVLRVALVSGGKVIEDRMIAAGEHVTIGATEKCTFLVAGVPPIKLFESTRAGYVLHVAPSMTGRVGIEGAAIDLGDHVARARGPSRLALLPASRGKIVIGSATLLFQFVEPPRDKPKNALPIAVRTGLFGELDWKMTFIAAFSFLIHFGAVGAVYADWTDEVIDDDVRVAQLVEELKAVPALAVEVATNDGEKSSTTSSHDPKKDDGGRALPQPKRGGDGTGGDKRRMDDGRAADLSGKLKAFDSEMIGALQSNGNATGAVIHDGNVPTGLLDDAGRSAGGVGHDKVAGLDLGGHDSGGVVRPGALRDGSPLGRLDGDGPAKSGAQLEVKKPVGMNIGVVPPPATGELPDAPRVIGGLRGGLRACYRRALDNEDPHMRGRVTVTLRVGPNGEVTSATPGGGGGLSSSMVSCVVARLKSAQFGPPASGGAVVSVPTSFEPQE